MMAFAGDTPAPATIVVITGDGDFIYAISTPAWSFVGRGG